MGEMFHGFEIIQPEKTDNYKCPGVWAMFGIRNEKNPYKKYTCLNVGKNKCIGDELKMNFLRIENFKPPKKKKYRNQFNEEMFDYYECATRQDWLYREIKEKYSDIIVILVAKEDEYKIEKYFAYSTKAIYWVSNGRYGPNRVIDDVEINRIRNEIDVSKIDSCILDKIKQIKDWYDNQ